MGTRSLTKIKDNGKVIACIYRQYDGYPTGLGEDLKKILNNGEVKICNGYTGGDIAPASFNGMGCLAAYLVGELKGSSIGNVYLHAPNTKDVGEEFIYTLENKENILILTIKDVWNKKTIYKGSLKEFNGQQVEKLANE